jgi:hypothetical protein
VTFRGKLIHGAPCVTARIRFSGIHGTVRLVVDTAAARTTLLDWDLGWLQVPPDLLEPAKDPMLGIGGATRYSLLRDVEIALESSDGLISFRQDVCALRHNVEGLSPSLATRILELPSFLGRDILNRFRLVYEYATGTVLLER